MNNSFVFLKFVSAQAQHPRSHAPWVPIVPSRVHPRSHVPRDIFVPWAPRLQFLVACLPLDLPSTFPHLHVQALALLAFFVIQGRHPPLLLPAQPGAFVQCLYCFFLDSFIWITHNFSLTGTTVLLPFVLFWTFLVHSVPIVRWGRSPRLRVHEELSPTVHLVPSVVCVKLAIIHLQFKIL
jgi:hypothetical protein